MTIVKVSVDEVEHLDEVVVDRAARETTKLIKVNMGGNVGPSSNLDNTTNITN